MRHVTKRLPALLAALALVLALLPAQVLAADYTYPLNGGAELVFDPVTGTIKDVNNSSKLISVEIPSAIYNIPVTAIGPWAFSMCRDLLSVTIPDSVTTIGDRAFASCDKLTSIVVPASVTEMGEMVFSGCDAMKTAAIYADIDTLPHGTFSYCDSLEAVTLSNSIETIENQAFLQCDALEELVLPDSVRTLERYAIYDCDNLKKITLGSGVETIAIGALDQASEVYFTGDAPLMDEDALNARSNPVIYYVQGRAGWSTPLWNGYVAQPYTPAAQTPSQPAAPVTSVTATPASASVLVNGQPVTFDAYNIQGNHYFKLRDLAFILSGSSVQFEVSWDGAHNAIALTSGRPYTPVGGEMAGKGGINQVGTVSTQSVYLDGEAVSLTAYTIQGNNYFKLRDIGKLFQFSVVWDGASQQIQIDTSKPYQEG